MIVPCGISSSLAADEREELYNFCKKLENDLAKDNIKVIGDYRENYSPGWKFNHWELKGVPIRMELGPRDVKNTQVVLVRRDNGQKITEKSDGLVQRMQGLLTGNLLHTVHVTYRISANNFRGNYSVLNLEIVENSNRCRKFQFFT